MNTDRSTYTSASNDTSSVRPRNRRLISYGGENDLVYEHVGSSTSRPQSKSRSPFPSRGVSPIPDAHPSRPPSSSTNARSVAKYSYGSKGSGLATSNASSGLGLWDSWSSIQSIASTLLGSDAQQAAKGKGGGAFNNSLWGKPGKVSGPRPPGPRWGPDTETGQNFTAGSKEERQAVVQAKKREALLRADVKGVPTSSAAHKRRDSDLRLSSSATPTEQDGDALVYVHKVKPDDTLAGVMIKYQCQPAVFRKVNRLWPNDNIQIREHVFLPVEACAIRGRKVDTDDSVANHDPLASSASEQSIHHPSHHFHLPTDTASPSLSPSPSTPANPEPEYKHEYFVSIPSIPSNNVEIARIPRRTLGFFPPSRRKSQTFSPSLDTDPHSYCDSPRPSLDHHHHHQPSSRLNPISSSLSLSLTTSPSRPQPLRPNRPHRSGSASHYFADRLKGPGGVGTLRGSGIGGAANPGPGEDSLNKMFAHRLPSVLPPGRPRESLDSVHSTASSSTGTGLENVGGLIEGWVRRVGGRIAGVGESSGGDGMGRGRGTMGELIELESNSGDQVDEGQAGWLVGTPDQGGLGGTAFDGPASSRRSNSRHRLKETGVGIITSTGVTATEEALLRERFPPRRRRMVVVDAQTNMNKRR